MHSLIQQYLSKSGIFEPHSWIFEPEDQLAILIQTPETFDIFRMLALFINIINIMHSCSGGWNRLTCLQQEGSLELQPQ